MITKEKKSVLVFILTFILVSCLNEKKDNEKISDNAQVVFSVTAASDTIALNEFAKLNAKLKRPYYSDAHSEIMVLIENNDSFPLKPDLSNENDIEIAVFLNLKHDTLNQKWMKDVDYDKTVVFGRKFSRTGKDTIRGYIMEYLGYTPPIDDYALDSVPVKKYYFEEEIFVIPNQE